MLVENIHVHWGIDQEYMPPPSEGTLATLDPALIVSPPPEFAVGYVPIVTRQEEVPPDDALLEQLSIDDVLGRYVRQPPANSWHSGEISVLGNGLQWENDGGASWPLDPNLADLKLLTNEQSPYFEADGGDAFILVLKRDENGSFIAEIEGFLFLGELYTRQP